MTAKSETYQIGELVFNTVDWSLSRSGESLSLTRQSAQLLHYLIENRDRTVPRPELIEQFWSLDRIGVDDSLNTCIRRIRSVIDTAGSNKSLIETRPRIGYRFVGEVNAAPIRSGVLDDPSAGRKWWIGAAIGATVVATMAAVVVSTWLSASQAPATSVYRNDGYRLDKHGDLNSSCDFEFEGGPGQCKIAGEGVVTISYRDRFLLRLEVTPSRQVSCKLGDGEVSCS